MLRRHVTSGHVEALQGKCAGGDNCATQKASRPTQGFQGMQAMISVNYARRVSLAGLVCSRLGKEIWNQPTRVYCYRLHRHM